MRFNIHHDKPLVSRNLVCSNTVHVGSLINIHLSLMLLKIICNCCCSEGQGGKEGLKANQEASKINIKGPNIAPFCLLGFNIDITWDRMSRHSCDEPPAEIVETTGQSQWHPTPQE